MIFKRSYPDDELILDSFYYNDDSFLVYTGLFVVYMMLTLIQFLIRGLFPSNRRLRILYGLEMPAIILSAGFCKDLLCGLFGKFVFTMNLYSVMSTSCFTSMLSCVPLLFYSSYHTVFWIFPPISGIISLLFAAFYIFEIESYKIFRGGDIIITLIILLASIIHYIFVQVIAIELFEEIFYENDKK